MISVAEALARVIASVPGPVEAEEVLVTQAHGRTLAADLAALRTQPPFDASAMDGYAVRGADLAALPARLTVVGTSAAGRRHAGPMRPGEAVRIFTGAPMPPEADTVVIQENTRAEGDQVVVEMAEAGRHVRRAGLDFSAGAAMLHAGERLDARRVALAAAMGHASLSVRRFPRVAILATGDELVRPGEVAGPDQIVASNTLALAALATEAGAEPIDLGIAGDTMAALRSSIGAACVARADILVTLGGASVGEHDLVQAALREEGMDLGFWRVALRPGKPLMHGRLGRTLVLGLPGNPVSSIVCGILFVLPTIRALLGDPEAGTDRSEPAILGRALSANDGRRDFLRARLEIRPGELPIAHPADRQDSSMLSVLGRSEALLERDPHAPPAEAGAPCRIIRLDRALR